MDAITAAAEHMVFYNEKNEQVPLRLAIWNCQAFASMTDTIWDTIVNERSPEYREKFQQARHMFERIDRREKYPYVGEVYLGAEPALQGTLLFLLLRDPLFFVLTCFFFLLCGGNT